MPPGVLTRSRGEVLALGDAGSLGHGGHDLLATLSDHHHTLGTGRARLGAQLRVPVGAEPGTLGHGPRHGRLLGRGHVGDDVEQRQGHGRHTSGAPHHLGGGPAEPVGVDRRDGTEAHSHEGDAIGPWYDGHLVGLADESLGREHRGRQTERFETLRVTLFGGDRDGDELHVVRQFLGVLDHGHWCSSVRMKGRSQTGPTERVGSEMPSCQRARVQSRSESRFR